MELFLSYFSRIVTGKSESAFIEEENLVIQSYTLPAPRPDVDGYSFLHSGELEFTESFPRYLDTGFVRSLSGRARSWLILVLVASAVSGVAESPSSSQWDTRRARPFRRGDQSRPDVRDTGARHGSELPAKTSVIGRSDSHEFPTRHT